MPKSTDLMVHILTDTFRQSEESVVKFSWAEFTELYGGQRTPRGEARENIRKGLEGNGLLIVYGQNVIAVTADQKPQPASPSKK